MLLNDNAAADFLFVVDGEKQFRSYGTCAGHRCTFRDVECRWSVTLKHSPVEAGNRGFPRRRIEMKPNDHEL
jgi:hypothetical protein